MKNFWKKRGWLGTGYNMTIYLLDRKIMYSEYLPTRIERFHET